MDIKDFPHSEIIGLEAKIVRSSNKDIININGKIIDETRKTVTLKTETQNVIAIKTGCTFEIKTKDRKIIEINGKLLYGRPEERIRKKMPKMWDKLE